MTKLIENLPEPERVAIELHSRGYNYRLIAEDAGIPYETIKGWFKKRGKLYPIYQNYIKDRNAKLAKATGIQIAGTAEDILKLDRILMNIYNVLLMDGLVGRSARHLAVAAKLKSLILGKPLYFKVYKPAKPITETEAQKEITKLNKIIKAMVSVWDESTKEKIKTEFANMEGLLGFL